MKNVKEMRTKNAEREESKQAERLETRQRRGLEDDLECVRTMFRGPLDMSHSSIGSAASSAKMGNETTSLTALVPKIQLNNVTADQDDEVMTSGESPVDACNWINQSLSEIERKEERLRIDLEEYRSRTNLEQAKRTVDGKPILEDCELSEDGGMDTQERY